VDTLDKAKDEEALDPQQREVRIKYACTVRTTCTSLGECLFCLMHALNLRVCFSLQFFSPQALYADTFNALLELLKNVLARDLSPDGLQSVFKVK